MVKRIVGWIVLVPLCAVLVVFALANRQPVVVNYNPFTAPGSVTDALGMPMFVVLFAVLLLGVIMGGVATWFAQSHARRDARHYRRETERLHRELEIARRSPAASALVESDDFVRTN